MSTRSAVAPILATVLLLGVMGPGLAYPRPGRSELISGGLDGAAPNSFSSIPSISADGRHVAFWSDASNIVSGDVNGFGDVFVRDRLADTSELVSVTSEGGPADGAASSFEISSDGRYVAFGSQASNLVPGDGNARSDIFIRDLVDGTTERVSVATNGTEGNQHSNPPISMSADGRYVAFGSFASNFAQGDTNGDPDIFVRDRVTGVTELVSRATGGALPNQASGGADLSSDGRYVAFHSAATNLAPDDTDEPGSRESDIFVRDLVTGVTERVSEASDGSRANVGSYFPSISGDGRYVAFYTAASNLVPEDANGLRDVFVHDRVAGVTERASVSSDGAGGNSTSAHAVISADGRHVAFASFASNLVPGDANGEPDIFVHDRVTGSTERVSLAGDGTEANSFSFFPAISADGSQVAFMTYASNLVPGDTNGDTDVVLRRLGPPVGVGGLEASSSGESVSGWATFNGDVVASATDAEGDAAPGAADAGADLTGATVVHRPEQEDLLVRLNVTRLAGIRWPYLGLGEERAEEVPFVPVAGAPGVLYGMELRAEGVRYEVRALRASPAAPDPPAEPYFGLYRCNPGCAEVARLTGGYGEAGEKVEVSIPLSALGTGEISVTGMRAFTALGEAALGSVRLLDEVGLPDATLLPPTVTLGIAPAGTPEDHVVFDTPAELSGGMFAGAVNAAPGEHEVWARGCLGETCGAASVGMTS